MLGALLPSHRFVAPTSAQTLEQPSSAESPESSNTDAAAQTVSTIKPDPDDTAQLLQHGNHGLPASSWGTTRNHHQQANDGAGAEAAITHCHLPLSHGKVGKRLTRKRPHSCIKGPLQAAHGYVLAC